MKLYIMARSPAGPMVSVSDQQPLPGRPGRTWEKIERLRQVIRHSPTGLNWGYGGSGPADTALSILDDLAGPEIADKWYQEFKSEFIAGLPFEGGIITEEAIREWLDRKETEYIKTHSKAQGNETESGLPVLPERLAE